MQVVKASRLYFNSQPHKEADIFSNASFSLFAYFNSQPHKEADILSVTMSDAVAISTHSLTRRLTWTVKNSLPSLQNFNSQPHKEADREEIQSNTLVLGFQLTASQGG